MAYSHLPRRPLSRWSSLLGAAAALAIVAIFAAFYFHGAAVVEQVIRERETTRVGFYTRLFRRNLQAVASDLRIQADGDGIRGYAEHGENADLDRALRRAIFLSRLHPEYDQIRFLSPDGREMMRVNQGGAAVPPGELQSKSDRSYVRDALGLAPGEIGLSVFDLNVERGRIEQPVKPTLRFSMPVYSQAGRLRGVYMINCLGDYLLGGFQELTASQRDHLRVANAEGYWIKGASPEAEWGFQIPGRAAQTLARSNPDHWARILQAPAGQIERDHKLFTWQRLVPAKMIGRYATGARGGDPFLIVGSVLPPAEWDAAFAPLLSGFRVASLALGLLALSVMWFAWLQRRQGAVLRESEERARLLIEGVRDYAIFMLDPKGMITSWNAGAERIKGYAAAEVVGRHYSQFFPAPAVRERLPERLIEQAKESDRVEHEGWRMRRDGSRFWAHAVLTAIRDSRGSLLGFAKVTRDLTAQKAAEAQIKQLNRDLQRRAEELEIANRELEAFSYSASHDLRAPLRHIAGFAKLLEEEAGHGLSSEGRRFLGVIADSAGRMARLIDDLLAFSKVGRTQLKRADIDHGAVVAAVIKDGRYGENGRRPIEWEIGPLGRAWADPGLMGLVWSNLIDNAVKYSGQSPFPRIEIGAQRDDAGETVYFIRDNGVGFDMQYSSKLFGVFQRLHRADQFEGTGIGLANVHRIVVRHGGRVWAESKLGAGAAFFFTLSGRPDAVQAPASP